MTQVVVKQPEPPKDEVPVEIIADSIVTISNALKKLRSGRLNDKALMLLIQQAMPQKHRVTVKQIRLIFDSIDALSATYLKRGR